MSYQAHLTKRKNSIIRSIFAPEFIRQFCSLITNYPYSFFSLSGIIRLSHLIKLLKKVYIFRFNPSRNIHLENYIFQQVKILIPQHLYFPFFLFKLLFIKTFVSKNYNTAVWTDLKKISLPISCATIFLLIDQLIL